MRGHLKVISISLVGVLIVLFGLFMMARTSARGVKFKAEFNDIIGLTNNAQVLFKGVKVGEVTSIESADKTGNIATLTITIKDSGQVEMQSDATLALRLKTLLGELYLDLDPGSDGEPLDTVIPVSQTHRDTSVDTILYQGAAVYDDIKNAAQTESIVDDVQSMLRTSGEDIEAISENTRIVTDGLASRVDTISTIISNLDVLTSALDGQTQELGNAIVGVNQTLINVRSMLVSNQSQIESLLNTINNVINSANLEKLDKLIADAPDLLSKLDQGATLALKTLTGEVPVLASFPLLEADAAAKVYAEADHIAKYNPVMRWVLIQVLEAYLNS